ncbi:hypothetical protein MUK42_09133 [Musa troglodytarum]|uniref:Uncharacterized protein n=1 Tax=Musa troglodytarum TaxID=320322 RepID=A0A9E7G258_9LILI|nr:hypothetical protein MUK42_09133 [Musa troglodytarum]URE05295.1 hypothetical protein MUK42_09133 [Musa troglodytarum]URE05299.1 hypothetical protein MUK42_09133 [Musa troglodytarum]
MLDQLFGTLEIEEQYLSNAKKQLERWHDVRNSRRADDLVNLLETMDRELETYKLVTWSQNKEDTRSR